MIKADSCPHLVLGLPSSASHSEATTGFAKASRRVKQASSSPFAIEDLTAALASLERAGDSSSFALRLSLPADPQVLELGIKSTFEGVSYGVESDLSPLLGVEPTKNSQEKMARVFLNAAIHRLLIWEWETAGIYAREVLRLARLEMVRDEALNALAVSLAMRGDTDRAIDALRKAVEGQWNLGLQTNLALIASDSDPELAVEQMAFLIAEADQQTDRIAACKLAIALWRKYQEDLFGDDDDLHDQVPSSVLEAAQVLLADRGLSEEDFYQLGDFLAGVDEDALAASGVLKKSPHAKTPSGKLIDLRTRDFTEYVKALVKTAAIEGDARPWIRDDVNQFVAACTQRMLNDESSVIAVMLSLQMIENGLDCSTSERIFLRALSIMRVCKMSLDQEGLPKKELITWLEEAHKALQSGSWVDEQHDQMRSFITNAATLLAIVYLTAYEKQFPEIAQITNAIATRMGTFMGRLSANKAAVGEGARAVWEWCHDAETALSRFKGLVEDPEILEALQSMSTSIHGIYVTVRKYGG